MYGSKYDIHLNLYGLYIIEIQYTSIILKIILKISMFAWLYSKKVLFLIKLIKPIMKSIYSALIIAILFLSCRDEALQYSCDPVLNEIVTAHIQEYAQYTVKDLVVYDLAAQQAIFRTYTPDKKLAIWLEKIQYLLDNENYTPEEYTHVAELLDYLSPNFFNPDTIKATTLQRAQFKSSWISFAKNSFGWTDQYIAFVVYRLYTQLSQLDAETKSLLSLQQKVTAGSEMGTCNCNQNDNFCATGLDCYSTGCDATSGGCGWFWTEPCVGQCLGLNDW